MDLTTLVSGHLRYLSLGSPPHGNSIQFNRTTGAGQAPGQGTAASPLATVLCGAQRWTTLVAAGHAAMVMIMTLHGPRPGRQPGLS